MHLSRFLQKIFQKHIRYIKKQRYSVNSDGSGTFQTCMQDMERPLILKDCQSQYPHYSKDDLAFVYEYASAGAIHVMLKWMEDSENITPEDFARRMDQSEYSCIQAVCAHH